MSSEREIAILSERPGKKARVADYLGLERNVVIVIVSVVVFLLGAGEPGEEIQQPMAVVILGGIVTSTSLNMIGIPALYLKYGRAEAHAPSRDYPGERELAPAGN